MAAYPWAVLGLSADANVTAIRRAYAQRLRETRPDEDPLGFQQLVEARDLALQLASGALSFEPPAVLWERPVPVDGGDPRPHDDEPGPYDRHDAQEPVADVLATDPLRERSQQQHDAFEHLTRALADENLTGWQAAIRAISDLAPSQRAALESEIIDTLNAVAAQEHATFAAWPRNRWPFFALVAALDEEFGWRENDRVLYEILGEDEARDFIELLLWSRSQSSADDGTNTDVDDRTLSPIALRDLHDFYDDGQDQKGLNAYHFVLGDPSLWRPQDAATDLFFPRRRLLREGRYGTFLLGLLGWIALLLSFAPWRLAEIAGALPRAPFMDLLAVAAAVLLMAVALWCLIGSSPAPSPSRKSHLVGPLWDSLAFFAFPLWALVRRLYGRAVVGLLAWIAFAYQLPEHQLGSLAAFMFVALLHITAGEYGQRWVLYKLQRTIVAADQGRIFDPERRSEFIRRHGTRSFTLSAKHSRRDMAASARRWSSPSNPVLKWLVIAGVIAGLARAIAAFWFQG
jgi:hypothetical protein